MRGGETDGRAKIRTLGNRIKSEGKRVTSSCNRIGRKLGSRLGGRLCFFLGKEGSSDAESLELSEVKRGLHRGGSRQGVGGSRRSDAKLSRLGGRRRGGRGRGLFGVDGSGEGSRVPPTVAQELRGLEKEID